MRLSIDTELKMHDGSEDGKDDMDAKVVIEKLIQSQEKRFSAVQHTILMMRRRSKRELIIASIFQRNCQLEQKFLLRTWQISREKKGN